ncbi:hypothetical protein [Psychrobacter sp. DM4]|uniref:hypothetical protein n=1 Tax=Psychrobacter sp. DM4 TaxID=3440637 RepID=UPI003F5085B6
MRLLTLNYPLFYTFCVALLLTGCQSFQFGGSPIPVTATPTTSGSDTSITDPIGPKSVSDISLDDK